MHRDDLKRNNNNDKECSAFAEESLGTKQKQKQSFYTRTTENRPVLRMRKRQANETKCCEKSFIIEKVCGRGKTCFEPTDITALLK